MSSAPTEDRPIHREGTLAFVPARFGAGITGGAEIVLRQMATRLQERGWAVEVLTTCAEDHMTWANVRPEGHTVEDGLSVRRFAAVVDTPGAERAAYEAAIHDGQALSISAQQRWMNDGMRVPGLWDHLLEHGRSYRAVILTPYMFWPTFAISSLLPERSVLWTCLHDEPYARLELFAPMLSGVAGHLLQSPPERDLLHRTVARPAPSALVGCGVEVPESYHVASFRERYGIDGPFLLYAGRREGAKGWEELLATFAAATVRRQLPFTLVTIGSGDIDVPPEVEGRVRDLGFLPDADRDAAFAAATAYLQPSRYEAFSRTIMEAWLAGTPVIAQAASDVLRYHCETSGAGLLYDDAAELEECLAFLAAAPEQARELAAAGRDYVLSRYTWEQVLDRVEQALEQFVPVVLPVDARPLTAAGAG